VVDEPAQPALGERPAPARRPDEPPLRPVGRDFASSLPGLFWLNWLGQPYVDLIGEERLLTVPGARRGPDGVLVHRGGAPEDWDQVAAREATASLVHHLGADLFFDKTRPVLPARAPRWL
jgi:hypothetical protein